RVVKIHQLKVTVLFRKDITFRIEIQAEKHCMAAISKMPDRVTTAQSCTISQAGFKIFHFSGSLLLLLTSPMEINSVQNAGSKMIHDKFRRVEL
ncbi:hypothetical protein V1505DRAFT_312908, partial [Lipomyces doorenjongii]